MSATPESPKPEAIGHVLSVTGQRVLDHPAELPWSCSPYIETPAETFVTNIIAPTCRTLVQGRYVAHLNGHSGIIVGPRGCGKTYALKRLALSASVYFPHLRVVYVSAEKIASPDHPLRKCGGLFEFIAGLGLTADSSAERGRRPAASGAGAHLEEAERPADVTGDVSVSFTSLLRSLKKEDIYLLPYGCVAG
jgi:hypothetical protein